MPLLPRTLALAVVWHTQATSGDMWNGACDQRVNCPMPSGPDFDFGAPPVLVNGKSGNDYLLAGQKSGMVFALDPSNEGRILWVKRLVEVVIMVEFIGV